MVQYKRFANVWSVTVGSHIYQRFIILSCDNVVSEEERDPELLDKLKLESEYIVCASIKFLRNAIARGYILTESERTKNNRRNYEIRNNSLASFLTDCCIIGEGKTKTKDFKETYIHWCKENSLPCERPNDISKILVEKFGVEKFKSNTDYYKLTIKNI